MVCKMCIRDRSACGKKVASGGEGFLLPVGNKMPDDATEQGGHHPGKAQGGPVSYTHLDVYKRQPGALHRSALDYVAAPRQAALLEKLLPVLHPEETQVFKRGRNANPHSHPRGATRREYQVATGLEALFGWLYLRGETGRLNELFEMMMEGED